LTMYVHLEIQPTMLTVKIIILASDYSGRWAEWLGRRK
jgi:hypothetical protein